MIRVVGGEKSQIVCSYLDGHLGSVFTRRAILRTRVGIAWSNLENDIEWQNEGPHQYCNPCVPERGWV
jgi:hypothetical protein